jgi:SAM-dependent methyltransferase
MPVNWNDLITRYLSGPAGRPKREALADEVARLSVLFTHPHERARLPRGYLDDRITRAAYAAYFAPANAEKTARVLRELAWVDPGLLRRPSLRIIDLGCGTGAAGLGMAAALEAAGASPRVTYEGLDVSSSALAHARWFLGEAVPAWSLQVSGGDLGQPAGTAPGRAKAGADLVLLADALNEAALPQPDPAATGADVVRRALALAAPGGYLVVIEPALRSLTRLLHAVRDRLLAADPGIRVVAPCLHWRPCPALAREDAWCHEERTWNRPGIVADIDRRIRHDKRWLKYAYLVLTRSGRTLGEASAERAAGAGTWRAVTNRHDVKGKTRIAGCGEPGWRDIECLSRHENDATRAFFELERGDVFAIRGAPPAAGGMHRLSPGDGVARWTS